MAYLKVEDDKEAIELLVKVLYTSPSSLDRYQFDMRSSVVEGLKTTLQYSNRGDAVGAAIAEKRLKLVLESCKAFDFSKKVVEELAREADEKACQTPLPSSGR